MQIEEAKELKIGYKAISKIASLFHETLINNIFDFEAVLKPMGGKITLLDSVSFEKSDNFFYSTGCGEFEFKTVNDDNMFKRVFLAQGLGHYVLHSQRGLIPCRVSSVSRGEASKEGFYFSLALLLKDELVIKMIEDGYSSKQIANLFRVPEKIVEIKKVLLRNNGDL